MTATTATTYSLAVAADRLASAMSFVEQAVADGLVCLTASGRIDEHGLHTLRTHYVESGQALRDLAQSSIDEGWYDISLARLRALGIVQQASEGDDAAGDHDDTANP
jgi:hypothetical protein